METGSHTEGRAVGRHSDHMPNEKTNIHRTQEAARTACPPVAEPLLRSHPETVKEPPCNYPEGAGSQSPLAARQEGDAPEAQQDDTFDRDPPVSIGGEVVGTPPPAVRST